MYTRERTKEKGEIEEVRKFISNRPDTRTCVPCLGSGKMATTPTSFGAWKVTCPVCGGEGKVIR